MRSILIFIPKKLYHEKSGLLFGKVCYDPKEEIKKFYVIGVCKSRVNVINPERNDVVGYFSRSSEIYFDKRLPDWINVSMEPLLVKHLETDNYNYRLKEVIVDGQNVFSFNPMIIIFYDSCALLDAESLLSEISPEDHFCELRQILQRSRREEETSRQNGLFCTYFAKIFTSYMFLLMFIMESTSRLTKRLLPVLKFSALGLHLNEWLDSARWMIASVIQNKGLTLKAGNYIIATILDILLGILLLRVLMHTIGDTAMSQILLDNAEKVVESLKGLVDWLMGAPAGLKLNHSFNKMLGKFFLYHIHLWWTCLVCMKPVLDFAFQVLLSLGQLGVTFQISMIADLLALVSFHSYCIYVYAARLFNLQLRGLTALFRLFLGKKKNPLRERVDSCEYQPDQLFVGTLLFTVLLFLMPTTWVYYSVFTTLRLVLIGLGGFLTRLKFYLQVTPVYAFLKWLFRSRTTRNSVNIEILNYNKGGPITLTMSTVVSPWGETWKRCIPDTVTCHMPIEWASIINDVLWGHLLYPL
ncbi:phosphatidylinositol N-acetylglucosaminyltransferase subunit Q [Orussus abietinus]|uniref:phosphatidylinositol N-acetylglucosaminyltransferase subunit Q n=1 Tax=Orussus abietinus TaxID=222816 RepID=UPI0006266C06|nr:phosphatidylinositol N-acetylglucosaminyltransferase subunit Q [Orussus abietinus]XP_012279104.1 phosphatidylinositol N-acetylglucosaminyltransferase subunit Q [Orussus abietinus]